MADVKIALPEGMTPAEFEKLFTTFQKQRIAGKAKEKAVASATKDLRAKHKAEYDALVEHYTKNPS